jgi:hypothetical protein
VSTEPLLLATLLLDLRPNGYSVCTNPGVTVVCTLPVSQVLKSGVLLLKSMCCDTALLQLF